MTDLLSPFLNPTQWCVCFSIICSGYSLRSKTFKGHEISRGPVWQQWTKRSILCIWFHNLL